jgi:hypothetical protein
MPRISIRKTIASQQDPLKEEAIRGMKIAVLESTLIVLLMVQPLINWFYARQLKKTTKLIH